MIGPGIAADLYLINSAYQLVGGTMDDHTKVAAAGSAGGISFVHADKFVEQIV